MQRQDGVDGRMECVSKGLVDDNRLWSAAKQNKGRGNTVSPVKSAHEMLKYWYFSSLDIIYTRSGLNDELPSSGNCAPPPCFEPRTWLNSGKTLSKVQSGTQFGKVFTRTLTLIANHAVAIQRSLSRGQFFFHRLPIHWDLHTRSQQRQWQTAVPEIEIENHVSGALSGGKCLVDVRG